MVLLEACYDSVESLSKKLPVLKYMPAFLQETAHILFEKLLAYRREKDAPIKLAKDFSQHIPVAFITSKADTTVPAQSVWTLARELVKNGHKQVYVLELEYSKHPGYMTDNLGDRCKYQQFVHALYKKLDLPYIAHYAEAGQGLLEACLQA